MLLKKILVAPAVLALAAVFGASVAFAAGPALSVGITPVVVTQNGNAATPNVTFARIRLSAVGSSDDIFVSNLPLTIATGNGALVSNLSNCHAVNLSTGGFLNNVPTNVLNGNQILNFDTPLRITAGTMTDVAIRCDIMASNAVNNTYAFNVNPLSVTATSAITGANVVPTIGTGVPTDPTTVTTTGSTGVVVIPGLPNTGMGGNATTNMALLALAGIVTVAGFAYTRRFAR